jgi:hypothetical protein
LTNVCSRYNEEFPSLSPCVRALNIISTKDTNSQSAFGKVQSTIESKHMGRISSMEFLKINEDKWISKLQRTPNGYGIHKAPRPNENNPSSRRTPNI